MEDKGDPSLSMPGASGSMVCHDKSDPSLSMPGASGSMDCHQEWVCDGFKVSAVDLAALVADDVSKRMETLLHDRFLESVEHRLVEIMQDLLPKFVSLQGEADSLRSKAGRSDSISSLPNPMQRAANPDMQSGVSPEMQRSVTPPMQAIASTGSIPANVALSLHLPGVNTSGAQRVQERVNTLLGRGSPGLQRQTSGDTISKSCSMVSRISTMPLKSQTFLNSQSPMWNVADSVHDHVLDGLFPRASCAFGSTSTSDGITAKATLSNGSLSLMPPSWLSPAQVAGAESTWVNVSSARGNVSDMALEKLESLQDVRTADGLDTAELSQPIIAKILMLLLRICGIMPWRSIWHTPESPIWQRPSVWYQWLISILAASGFAVCLHYLLNKQERSQEFDCQWYVLLSDIPLTLGCFPGMLALATYKNSHALNRTFQLLYSYAYSAKFVQKWLYSVGWDIAITVLLWVAAVIERARGTLALAGSVNGEVGDGNALRIIAFAMCSFFLMMIVACILSCCRVLSSAVDAFCSGIVSTYTLDHAVHDWNVLQAMLRKASETIQACMLVLLTTLTFTLALGGFDIYRIHTEGMSKGGAEAVACFSLLAPGLLLFAGIGRAFFVASEVTAKCTRVPSLINACVFIEEDIDFERQYVVEYVLHSAAGFYMFEIQVTTEMILKFSYISAVVFFAFIVQFVLRE